MNTVCGKRKSISRLDKKSDLSWPWVVALYQYKLVGKTARYKAGGSIISTKFVITSGNALFYEGRLLLAEEVRVHVSRTDISPHENQKTLKIYRVRFLIMEFKLNDCLIFSLLFK